MKNRLKDFSVDATKFLLVLALGALIASLMLDNRFGAMVKAFNNPNIVNGLSFQVEVVKK